VIEPMLSLRNLARRRTRLFLLGGFLLLSLMVFTSFLFAARERYVTAAEQNDLLIASRLSDLLSTVRQSESGMRGYLLTGNQLSLTTYNLSLTALPAELSGLDKLFRNRPDAPALDQVHRLVAQKLAQLAAAITLYQSGNHAAATALVNTDLNLQTMQQLRALINGMEDEQTRRFFKSETIEARDGWRLQAATTFAVLGTFLLAWFAIRENRRQNQQLRDAETALLAANEMLEGKVADRTRTLQISESRFRTLAESMPGFVFMADANGANTYINPQFSAFTGRDIAELRDAGWDALIHPDDQSQARDTWDKAIAAQSPCEIEHRFLRHDGIYRWFLVRALPLTDEAGAFAGWIATCTDIDARKQAEAALAEYNITLERRVTERSLELDRIFRMSTDILSVTGHNGVFISLSPAWERITGYTVEDTIGRSYFDFVHPDDMPSTKTAAGNLRNGTSLLGFENRYRRADGTWCWLSWRAVPLPEEGLVYSIARDITQDKAREEQLRQSQKMEVVGQLTGGVAHDFNNLLTIIMGSLELLQRNLATADARTIRRVDAAMDGARRAAALTHRLLAFSRRQPLAPESIDANRLLAGMSDMLYRTLGESIAIEIVAGAGLWPAMADSNQLENAILNLAVNARDAMPGGGRLTIETQNTFLDDDYAAAYPDVDPGQYIQIAVADTGTGMTADVQAKVFEPFFTTKPQGQGTGLGLAQVYGFIKQSGGHVAVYSEAGHGTTIKLYLPRLRGTAAQPAPTHHITQEHAGSGEIILLVEDEEGVRNFSAEVLEDLGYRVLAAENAATALEIFHNAKKIDLLFTDVVLTGGMNGRHLADEILRHRPDTTVLFTTGYTRNAIIHHGRLDDGINFLGKPFTAATLAQTIRRLLDQTTTRELTNSTP
jgi:PAS domain S-box-containing protein